ncbi:MAG TPA: class I SAM-dependent methyltransferase [Solirubrobacterales bacterium]|nr:class I SAM-dependent methyltransferase [Solirubrobacterales bacterium]
MSGSTKAIWHDVECGSYDADLPLWEELAERCGGPILELGCGTGRVSLFLARRGHQVIGLDQDQELLDALAERAADSLHTRVGRKSDASDGVAVEPVHADAQAFELAEEVGLVLAPTHLLQLLPDSARRIECLRCIAAALRPGGLLAAAIIESMPEPDGAPPPLPDVREVDGWVYSSLAIEAAVGPGEIVVRRLRQLVSPEGSLSEEPNEVRIATFTAEALEAEAAICGLVPAGRREIPPTTMHEGSLVVLLERSA